MSQKYDNVPVVMLRLDDFHDETWVLTRCFDQTTILAMVDVVVTMKHCTYYAAATLKADILASFVERSLEFYDQDT